MATKNTWGVGIVSASVAPLSEGSRNSIQALLHKRGLASDQEGGDTEVRFVARLEAAVAAYRAQAALGDAQTQTKKKTKRYLDGVEKKVAGLLRAWNSVAPSGSLVDNSATRASDGPYLNFAEPKPETLELARELIAAEGVHLEQVSQELATLALSLQRAKKKLALLKKGDPARYGLAVDVAQAMLDELGVKPSQTPGGLFDKLLCTALFEATGYMGYEKKAQGTRGLLEHAVHIVNDLGRRETRDLTSDERRWLRAAERATRQGDLLTADEHKKRVVESLVNRGLMSSE